MKAEFKRFPKTWKVLPFSDAIKDITGGNPKVKSGDYQEKGTLAVIDQGQAAIAGYIDDETLACNALLPSIIFGDHTKALKFVEHPFALGADGVKVLEPIEGLNKRFVYHYLNQLALPDNAGYSRHFKFLKEKFIPLPPLPEQRRIAAILDKADAIRRKRQQAIRLTEEFLRSVFLDMFGNPVTNPKGWEVRPLEKVVLKITDGTHHSPPIVEDGVPYITAKHLKKGGLDFFAKPWFISKEDHTNIYKRCNPEIGDVLYIKDGATTGIAAVNEYDFEFSMLSSLALIKPDIAFLTSEYLCDWLNNSGSKDRILKRMAGAAITRLTIRKIKDLKIELPPIELQRKYSVIRKRVRAIVMKQAAVGLVANENSNSLVQRAFQGEL